MDVNFNIHVKSISYVKFNAADIEVSMTIQKFLLVFWIGLKVHEIRS